MNNVSLVGRLTKDSDLRYTASGKGVASFTLAVNRRFTNQAGEREADYIQCVIWGKSAETLANYSRKGSLLAVTGRIQTRSYENNQGNRVYVTEVVVEQFQLLESKATNEQRQANQAQQANQKSSSQSLPEGFPSENDMPTGSSINISDDDMPF